MAVAAVRQLIPYFVGIGEIYSMVSNVCSIQFGMEERPVFELESELTQGSARIDAAMCAWLLTLAEFDRRSVYEQWEVRSSAHWLNWRCGISLRTARDHVRVARRLEELPLVQAKFADGELSYSKVRAISKVATPETEETLVEWAIHATAAQLDKIVQGRKSVERKSEKGYFLEWHNDDDGDLELRGKLSAEEGALVIAALKSARTALEDDQKNGSAEPHPVTNVDALVAVAETVLAHGPTPVEAGDRHLVVLHVNAETGEGRLDDGPVLSTESKQQIMCGASWATFVKGTYGEALFMGRLNRFPNRAQRRALKFRDGGCAFPGCTQRIWVDAHHIVPWEEGGLTGIDNLLLLCRFHHTAVHHRGVRIEKCGNQRFRFYDKEGFELIAVPALEAPTGFLADDGASGRPITPDTPLPDLHWRSPDYADAVEGLMWLEENAHKVLAS